MSNNASHQSIEQLLERFYNGTSTPAEQAQLTRMLASQKEVPQHLRPDRDLFAAIASERDRMPPPALPAEFSSRREAWSKLLTGALRIPRWGAAAAAAAVVVSITLFSTWNRPESDSIPVDNNLISDIVLAECAIRQASEHFVGAPNSLNMHEVSAQPAIFNCDDYTINPGKDSENATFICKNISIYFQ